MRTSERNVTTGGAIDGWAIDQHLGLVTAHVVAGTGIGADIFAGFSDFFGGRSGAYKKQLESLQAEAIRELLLKARQRKGNWIVGLRVEMDSISGKGKQMFMVTAYGTAVNARPTSKLDTEPTTKNVSPEELDSAAQRIKLLRLCENKDPSLLNEENFQRLIELRLPEAMTLVLESARHSTEDERGMQRAVEFFDALDPGMASDFLYDHLLGSVRENADAALMVIRAIGSCRLDLVESALRDGDVIARVMALQSLRCHQQTYDISHIDAIDRIQELLSNSPWPKAQSESKARKLGRNKTVWQCACGSPNEHGRTVYCLNCGRDRAGFKSEQMRPEGAVEVLESRKQALSLVIGLQDSDAAAT